MPPGKRRIPLALRGRIGTIGPDRIATTGPLSEPTVPVSPQGGDLRSLRGKSVQEAFRGVLVCQGPGNRSLPGKARGFRGQDTVERHGGFSAAAVKKVLEWEQENLASKGREMIDDFRLRGSRPCRRMGGPLSDGGWRMQVVHDFDNYKSALSEGEAPRRCGPGCAWESALDVGSHGFPESSGVKHRAAPAPRVPASHGASWRRTGGGGSGGSDPPFLTAGAAPGGVSRFTSQFTVNPPLGGSLPPQ